MWKTRALGLFAAASILTTGAAVAAGGKLFTTQLRGAKEVPARHSHAQGLATFQANEDGTELRYKLNVAYMANVFQAHIHLGPIGPLAPRTPVWMWAWTTLSMLATLSL